MRKHSKRRYFILLLMLGFGVGFAFLSATLYVNGSATIKGNKWDIHFDNVVVNSDSISADTPTINDDKDTVNYSVMLDEPGDFYEFTVDAVNAGTLDGVLNSFTNTALTTEQAKYLKYTVTYADGVKIKQGEYLRAGSKVTYKVRVEYDEDASVIPEEDVPVSNFSFTANFGKSDKKNYFEIVKQAEDDKLSVGDEVSIGTEHFNVLTSDSEKTVLLAKYNLKVGILEEWEEGKVQAISSIDDDDYCLQTSLSKTDHENYEPSNYGLVSFSLENYWYEGKNIRTGTLKEKYGSSYPATIYDEDYDSDPGYYVEEIDEYSKFWRISNHNYSVAYYVKQYGNILKRMGMSDSATLRLLLLSDVENLETIEDEELGTILADKYAFIYATDFYMGTAYDNTKIYTLYGTFKYFTDISAGFKNGVRPVIEVPTSEILG